MSQLLVTWVNPQGTCIFYSAPRPCRVDGHHLQFEFFTFWRRVIGAALFCCHWHPGGCINHQHHHHHQHQSLEIHPTLYCTLDHLKHVFFRNSTIIALSCPSLRQFLLLWRLDWYDPSVWRCWIELLDLSKLWHRFVKVVKLVKFFHVFLALCETKPNWNLTTIWNSVELSCGIFQSYNMDFSKLSHRFVKIYTCLSLSNSIDFSKWYMNFS